MGSEVQGFSGSHTSYVRAGSRTSLSASAFFIQTDIQSKCILGLIKAELTEGSLFIEVFILKTRKCFRIL